MCIVNRMRNRINIRSLWIGLMGILTIMVMSGCMSMMTERPTTAKDTKDIEAKQKAQAKTALDAKSTKIPKGVRTLGDKVVIKRVLDGDTVEVTGKNGDETVRLSLVDTPETVHPNKPKQKFGHEASEFTKSYLTKGTRAVLERGYTSKDRYGRTLGYLWVGEVNFNQLLLELGYARMSYIDLKERYVFEFEKAQKKAKHRGLNIWSIDGYVTKKGFDMTVVSP